MRISPSLLGLGLAIAPGIALAGPPDGLGVPGPGIYNGQPVESCGWPTTVAVTGGGNCTGTLVHPRVVVYAAHCGDNNKSVRFGSTTGGGSIVVPEEFCMVNPAWSTGSQQGIDWAFCVLSEDVPLPITPILFGCEEQILTPGQEIAIVGFGTTENSGYGEKRWATTTIDDVNFFQNEVDTPPATGSTGAVCPGDSGGPAFIQLADGGWRVFGIASTKNVSQSICNEAGGTHSLLSGAVEWIEENSGYDVTPCFDAETETWDPGPLCGNIPTEGADGFGNYNTWCEGTPVLEFSSTCGPSFGEQEESNPPIVSITSPFDGETFPESLTIPVVIDATDDSGFVTMVELEIDGTVLPDVDSQEPWQFSNVTFPEGAWTIRAIATDFWGNKGESAPVTIYVGDVEPPGDTGDETTDDGGTEETTDDGETETTTTDEGTESSSTEDDAGEVDEGEAGTGFPETFGEDPDGGAPPGCACDVNRGGGSGVLAGMGLLLLGLGRRRRLH